MRPLVVLAALVLAVPFASAAALAASTCAPGACLAEDPYEGCTGAEYEWSRGRTSVAATTPAGDVQALATRDCMDDGSGTASGEQLWVGAAGPVFVQAVWGEWRSGDGSTYCTLYVVALVSVGPGCVAGGPPEAPYGDLLPDAVA